MRIAVCIVALVYLPPSAQANDLQALLRNGYEVIWQGYASVPTCVHDRDHFKLGRYLFVCDQYTYEYPYHYGDVSLMSAQRIIGGKLSRFSYICLDDVEECIEGSIYTK